MGSRPRATSLPAQPSVPTARNLTDILEDSEGAATPSLREEQADPIQQFYPSFSVPLTPTAAYSHGPSHGHHRSSSLDRLQTGASVVRPLTYRDRIISSRYASRNATPRTSLSRQGSPQTSRRASNIGSKDGSRAGTPNVGRSRTEPRTPVSRVPSRPRTPFRYYSRRPSSQGQASTGIDTDYIDTALRELIHDPLSRILHPRRPQAGLTSGLHLYPDGTFIAPLRRDITSRRWEERVEPITPVLARTLTWPPTKQFDPTSYEAKQRWGTPDWSSPEENALDDESTTFSVQGQDTDVDDQSSTVPVQDQDTADETATQDPDTVVGTPKLRTINAILYNMTTAKLTIGHVRFLVVPLIWLYAAQHLRIKRPRFPRSFQDLSLAIIRDIIWYFLIVIPLTLLHPPPLITQFFQPLPKGVMKALPILQIRIGRKLCILDDRLFPHQDEIVFSDRSTDFWLVWWAEPLFFRPIFFVRKHLPARFLVPKYWHIVSFLAWYGIIAVWKFVVIDVFHGTALQWLW